MIESSFVYIFTLLILVIFFLKFKSSIFRYLPRVVILYLSVLILSFFGFWEHTQEQKDVYIDTKTYVLPMVIFLFMAGANLSVIKKLKAKLLLSFFLTTISLLIGFYTLYFISSENWQFFSTLFGGWMGGMANMMAVAEAYQTPQEIMGFVLISDSINYTIWVSLLIFLVSISNWFDSKVKASAIATIDPIDLKEQPQETFLSNFKMGILALFISFAVVNLSHYIGSIGWISVSVQVVVLMSIIGILFGYFKPQNAQTLSQIFLYILIALIASQTQIEKFDNLFVYVGIGFFILIIHAFLMVVFAKIFRLNLFLISVASLAHIGGIASASILASTYHKDLTSIGIIMAILGYILGTFVALLFGWSLQ